MEYLYTDQELKEFVLTSSIYLMAINEQTITNFCNNICPLTHASKCIHIILYDSIHYFYQTNLRKNQNFTKMQAQFEKIAQNISPEFCKQLLKIFDRATALKIKIKFEDLEKKKKVVLQEEGEKIQETIRSDLFKKDRKHFKKQVIAKLYKKKDQSNFGVLNLNQTNLCLCGQNLSFNPLKDKKVFKCYHCQKIFHISCMKRKNTKYCSICHLIKLIPTSEVKQVLFLGVLQKGRGKHEIFFNTDKKIMSTQYKIQVRCFRLKQNIQNGVLFPDSSKIILNTFQAKKYEPLNKYSSLKYRKDEPLNLDFRHIYPKNRISISQIMPSQDKREERIQIQNHLIGIFAVQSQKIEPLTLTIKKNSKTQFKTSLQMLLNTFFIGSQTSQLSCDIIKIPLTCTLTTQKINIPVRGALCTHFQCFDLQSYLKMISCSTNPRWVCPLCRMCIFEFRLDCIMEAVLQEYSDEGPSEILFFKSGEFTVNSKEKAVKNKIHNIHDLDIADINANQQTQPQYPPQKKRKTDYQIPQDSTVICLLDE